MTLALPRSEIDALGREAATIARRAYAPYSGFHVAALLIGDDGLIASGVNMENASYGLTLCAETAAFAAAVHAGRLADVRAVLVIGGRVADDALTGTAPVMPCGRCRQIIHESAALQGRDIAIVAMSGDGEHVRHSSIGALLPDAFGPDALDARP